MKTNQGARYGRILAIGVLAALGALPAAAQTINAQFHAVPERQAVGQPVQFFDDSTGNPAITEWLWNFGDGTTSTAENPTHIYTTANPDGYTVTLRVSSSQLTATATRENYIQILDPPFVDFVGIPDQGPPPLTVTFTDESQPQAGITRREWDFGDESPIALGNPVMHTYQEAGEYSVTLTVYYGDQPPVTLTKDNYIVVAESEEQAASFDAAILVRDSEGVLPLSDWVPLFSFNMSYSDPGFRYLDTLVYEVTGDLIEDPNSRNYVVGRGPQVQDLLDFAIFVDDRVNGEVDAFDRFDGMLIDWDNTGFPVGSMQQVGGALRYTLNFRGPGRTLRFPGQTPSTGPSENINGFNYIVAVRTSALWHSSMTMSVRIPFASMFNPGGIEGDDTFPNNDWADGPVEEAVGYSASFSVHDITQGSFYDRDNSGGSHGDEWRFGNNWNYPQHQYIPLAEFTRPRWDLTGNLFEVVSSEAIGLRQLFPVEYFVPLVGINIHSTKAHHYQDSLRPDEHDRPSDGDPWLREVNMVFVDIGHEPGEPAGLGGFDPRKHLDPMTGSIGIGSQGVWGDNALNIDFAFNGAWIWHDTSGNGVFDYPTVSATGGINFSGKDYPMFPDTLTDFGSPEHTEPYLGRWNYVENPPDGGDPWWTIKLRTDQGRRRETADTEPTGYLEASPDNLDGQSKFRHEHTYDYFVVFRADSGFQDSSMVPGDGTGYLPGADFKAFVEPRWFNAEQGHWQGGIHSDAQIPGVGIISADRVITAWQDDPRWQPVENPDEPFWPERTANEDTAKAMRGGLEVHDYTILYDTDSRYATSTNIFYPTGALIVGGGTPDLLTSFFEEWLDPTGTRRGQFYYGDDVVVYPWSWYQVTQFGGTTPLLLNDTYHFVYPFETAPFFKPVYDRDVAGPRSPLYPAPPAQPTLPTYATWPANLPEGRYPSILDWAPGDIRARYLKQYIDINSPPTPMLGINLVGANDPLVNRVNARFLNELYVAFWGKDFTPDDLQELEPDGGTGSGVQLRVDGGDGVYNNPSGLPGITGDTDPPVTLKNLAWRDKPERIDLDGDGAPDDLDGDGDVDAQDVAWVLRLIPLTAQPLPISDQESITATAGKSASETEALPTVTEQGSLLVDFSQTPSLDRAIKSVMAESAAGSVVPEGESAAGIVTETLPLEETAGPAAGDAPVSQHKAINLRGNPGDDLYITVQTSDKLKRFEEFRAFLPAKLPDRPAPEQLAGVKTTPSVELSPDALVKVNPEEMVVQDYYYHDLLPTNMPVKLTDETGSQQTIGRSSPPRPAMGIDVSTNRGTAAIAAQGTSGTGAAGSFTVTGVSWSANSFAGAFLIDSQNEAHEITGNTATQLTLLGSFTPANGRWTIVKDPSFLEQVIVELYDEGDDGQFNPIEDLLPLDADEPQNSGVMIYRDNDASASNQNGVFDPGDIPLTLDDDPDWIGEVGEVPYQVRFVFSSPGTDDLANEGPVPRAQQPHLRQYIPETFGVGTNDPNTGADFFVVLRTSSTINPNDDFRVGIVCWGPDTPTQPDPDTFTGPNVPMNRRDDLSQFLEYPWGSRALGFITVFQQAPDDSGVNWIRTSTTQAMRTRRIAATGSDDTPGGSLNITNVTPAVVQTTIGTNVSVTITGTGFGTAPTVRLNGLSDVLTDVTATNTRITGTLVTGTVFAEGPITVQVVNTTNNAQDSDDTLMRAVAADLPPAPVINSITPSSGTRTDFPVEIRGANFVDQDTANPEPPTVQFGGREMPVAFWSPSGNQITVNFPLTDLRTGSLDVTVNAHYLIGDEEITLSVTEPGGFTYVNAPPAPRSPCFIATAAYGTPLASRLDTFRAFRDEVLLPTAAGTAAVDLYYSVSPSVADYVATQPWLAALVRGVLTPLAYAMEQPLWLGVGLAFAALLVLRRRPAPVRVKTRD